MTRSVYDCDSDPDFNPSTDADILLIRVLVLRFPRYLTTFLPTFLWSSWLLPTYKVPGRCSVSVSKLLLVLGVLVQCAMNAYVINTKSFFTQ